MIDVNENDGRRNIISNFLTRPQAPLVCLLFHLTLTFKDTHDSARASTLLINKDRLVKRATRIPYTGVATEIRPSTSINSASSR